MTFKSMEGNMYHWKGSEPVMPKIKGAISEFYELLNKSEWDERLNYSGGKLSTELISCGDENSLTLWNPDFAKKFINCEQIFMDGTFSRFPLIAKKKELRTHSLFTVHALYENNVSVQIAIYIQ